MYLWFINNIFLVFAGMFLGVWWYVETKRPRWKRGKGPRVKGRFVKVKREWWR